MAMVTILGAKLAELAFTGNSVISNQEGLIFGKSRIVTTNAITDDILNVSNHQVIYDIEEFSSAYASCQLFDQCGEINMLEFSSACQGNVKKVIGWYKIRNHSLPFVSLRDACIHRNLLEYVNDGLISSPDIGSAKLVFSLWINSSSFDQALHISDHIIMTKSHEERLWNQQRLSIQNLTVRSSTAYCTTSCEFSLTDNSTQSNISNQAKSMLLQSPSQDAVIVPQISKVDALFRSEIEKLAKEYTRLEETIARREDERKKTLSLLAQSNQNEPSAADEVTGTALCPERGLKAKSRIYRGWDYKEEVLPYAITMDCT